MPAWCRVFDDAGQLAEHAAALILAAARLPRAAPFTWCWRAGRPLATYARLAGAGADWRYWRLYFSDERCLPAGDPGRNDTWIRRRSARARSPFQPSTSMPSPPSWDRSGPPRTMPGRWPQFRCSISDRWGVGVKTDIPRACFRAGRSAGHGPAGAGCARAPARAGHPERLPSERDTGHDFSDHGCRQARGGGGLARRHRCPRRPCRWSRCRGDGTSGCRRRATGLRAEQRPPAVTGVVERRSTGLGSPG